jgi:DNA-binding MarR family transcriptional regulator
VTTTASPVLSTQVIGQAEGALGAILDPLLADAGITFAQWLVFVVTSKAGDESAGRDLVISQITAARNMPAAEVAAAISELSDSGLIALAPGTAAIRLTADGQAKLDQVRTQVERITGRLFDLPEQDLATAGRVLSVITARAKAEARARIRSPQQMEW